MGCSPRALAAAALLSFFLVSFLIVYDSVSNEHGRSYLSFWRTLDYSVVIAAPSGDAVDAASETSEATSAPVRKDDARTDSPFSIPPITASPSVSSTSSASDARSPPPQVAEPAARRATSAPTYPYPPRPEVNYTKIDVLEEGKDLVTSARLIWVNGWPICVYKNICIEGPKWPLAFRVGYFDPVDWAHESLRSSSGAPRDCRRFMYAIEPREFWAASSGSSSRRRKGYLKGSTLLLDTYIPAHHWGHVSTKLFQAASLTRSESYDHVVLYPMRKFFNVNTTLWELSNYLLPREHAQSFLTAREVQEMPDRTLCLETAYVLSEIPERKFSSARDVALWRSDYRERIPDLREAARVAVSNPCPQPRAAILYRVDMFEIDGRHINTRPWSNYAAIGAALKSLGVCRYENATSHPGMTVAQQASMFASYGLIISVHSTQLHNNVFMHNLSAVLEVTNIVETTKRSNGVVDEWDRYPSPFCVHELCPPLYKVSMNHSVEAGFFRDAVYDPKIPLLTRDLRGLLDRQRVALRRAGCPALWEDSGCA